MKYDEYELIEFFGVLPTEQEAEEKEIFGSTIFDYHQDQYHLSVSYSIYREDFYLDLKDTEKGQPLLTLRLERVEAIMVKSDKPTSTPVLVIKARGNGEDNSDAVVQTVQVSLEPTIYIQISNA